MKCVHSVELELDVGHTCSDCDVQAATQGLPPGARVIDVAQYAKEMWGATKPSTRPHPWSAEGMSRLMADLKAVKPSSGEKAAEDIFPPKVEELAITAWWRERYGSADARRKTRTDAMRRAADHNPLDINGDPVLTGTPVDTSLNAVVVALRRELMNSRATIDYLRGQKAALLEKLAAVRTALESTT